MARGVSVEGEASEAVLGRVLAGAEDTGEALAGAVLTLSQEDGMANRTGTLTVVPIP